MEFSEFSNLALLSALAFFGSFLLYTLQRINKSLDTLNIICSRMNERVKQLEKTIDKESGRIDEMSQRCYLNHYKKST
jgi:hypothetical protein